MRNIIMNKADFNMSTEALTYTQGLDFAYTYKMKRKWNSFYNLLKPFCI